MKKENKEQKSVYRELILQKEKDFLLETGIGGILKEVLQGKGK